ncbi:pirin family protein [Comamonas endophytica]|uniref:Pirin family protein n=1 Tax=Comamonas endophytica TaxID=2949090 RepID=A0ABY6GAC1_9BURK|nr:MULTISPECIES: pirin family protein [unclassified Acidovorax]MCD2512038.1 pirin family protein [Acidovorax sp. D4N7]UYG51818.1 pirin family protein [Acidovorax sp. 5MLIR]
MIDIRKSDDRGRANHGWLQSRHTFSFSSYRDLRQQGFSDLLVINDDHVAPAKGFGTHGHRDMEIFSYVLEGELAHKDSMGTGSVIVPGDVQMMSAGSGVQHSEFNHSAEQPVHFLQIWIVPNERGAEPRYQQVRFEEADKRGQLRLIIAPNGENGALAVRQDARVYAGLFDGDEAATLDVGANRNVYVHVARGSLEVNGERLSEGDGARIRNAPALRFGKGENAEVLVFDLRPNELPTM